MSQNDTFPERYSVGYISGPTLPHASRLLTWFAERHIAAGVMKVSAHEYRFIVPYRQSDHRILVGVIENDKLEYALLADQLALDLAREFSVDVALDEWGESPTQEADWSDVEALVDSPEPYDEYSEYTYIISKAKNDTALGLAQSLEVQVEYARVSGRAIWRLKQPHDWYEAGFLKSDLPAFIFQNGIVAVQYGMVTAPVPLASLGEVQLSLSPTDVPYEICCRLE